jgi:hypothetical protein
VNKTYIKLFIGAVLFGTLVALTVLQVPRSERLVDLIYAALLGLGIMHLGDQSGAPDAPVTKQGGFASIVLLVAMAIIAMLVLAGCTTTAQREEPQQATRSAQVTYTQACAAYGAGFATALELRREGKLNRAQIDQVTLIDSQVTPVCTGRLPADPDAAVRQVTAAVTALAILEAVKKGGAQ